MIDVSLVIPCYNSAAALECRVRECEAVLSDTRWTWEILLCDDGSRDATPDICRRLASESSSRRYLPSAANRGRGRNVSEGFLQSRGKVVGFIDADASTAAFYLIPVIQAVHAGYEAAEAHRTYKIRLLHLPFIINRLAAHLSYAFLVRLLLGIRGHDTESGFKFFQREAALTLVEMTRSPGWFWDTEVIAHAHALGYRVAEIPSLFVRTKGMPSTVNLLKDSWSQLTSLLAFVRSRGGAKLAGPCCAP